MNPVQKAIYVTWNVVRFPFRPNTWRWLLWHDMKVRVYLDSGQYVNVYCESFNIKLSDGSKSYSFKGLRREVLFDPGRIIAVEKR